MPSGSKIATGNLLPRMKKHFNWKNVILSLLQPWKNAATNLKTPLKSVNKQQNVFAFEIFIVSLQPTNDTPQYD